MENADNEWKCCKFCGANLENVIDTRVKHCKPCNVRFYGKHTYRIIFRLDSDWYWFTCSTYSNKTYLYKRTRTRYCSRKLGEWDEVLEVTPDNAGRKLKTILVFM